MPKRYRPSQQDTPGAVCCSHCSVFEQRTCVQLRLCHSASVEHRAMSNTYTQIEITTNTKTYFLFIENHNEADSCIQPKYKSTGVMRMHQ